MNFKINIEHEGTKARKHETNSSCFRAFVLSRYFAIFLFVFSTLSCQKAGILPEKTMAHIIADMHLLEGSMSMSGVFRTENKKREAYYNSIFQKHNTNAEQFEKSMAWYAKKPLKLEAIYAEADKILKNLEEEVKATEQAEKEEKESQSTEQ